jgi:aspartyl aminopeptidase
MAKKKDVIKDLGFEKQSAWKAYEKKLSRVDSLSKEYLGFLDKAKTEREAIQELKRLARKKGFKELKSKPSKKGKYFMEYKDKNLALIVVGKQPAAKGFRFVAAHVDSPRLDLKPMPLYEDKQAGVCMLDTHYYGGIKKFHWVNHPLAVHGVVCLKNGKTVEVKLG